MAIVVNKLSKIPAAMGFTKGKNKYNESMMRVMIKKIKLIHIHKVRKSNILPCISEIWRKVN